ncbi:hypothetical protein BGZ99_004546 [Dissophora globulifera]|uniref:Uncharacterized protein n=1 Tax=Dissophora globulifera TaxID=979702 RepID=A0A9P6UTP5_9FUNG|nr:hypothetical protein BGZ99_004546 [Dissophora globulifera]
MSLQMSAGMVQGGTPVAAVTTAEKQRLRGESKVDQQPRQQQEYEYQQKHRHIQQQQQQQLQQQQLQQQQQQRLQQEPQHQLDYTHHQLRDPQMMERQQQQWEHGPESAAPYGVAPQQPTRDSGRYGPPGAPTQDSTGHPRTGHHQHGGPPSQLAQQQMQQPPQQQLYPGQQEHHGILRRSPTHDAPAHIVDPSTTSRRRAKGQGSQTVREQPEEIQRYHTEYDQYEQQIQQQKRYAQQQQQQQERQEHIRQHAEHPTQAQPPHQLMPYPPSTQPGIPAGRRSASHSRNSSMGGNEGLPMMISPVNPPSSSMDLHGAPIEHPMRIGSPGPSGHGFHHGAQVHVRSRGSSPALGGYSPSSHGPMPVSAPITPLAPGSQRQGSHSRNSSMTYEMGAPRSQVPDPYMTRPGVGPGSGSGSYPSQPPPHMGHHPRSSMDYPPSNQQQQQQQVRHPQELRPGYGHSASRSQDMSALGVSQPPPRSHSRTPSEVYGQQIPVQGPLHPQQQGYQHQQAAQQQYSRHAAPPGHHGAAPSRAEQQWYQEQQHQHPQYQTSQHQQQPLQQQPTYQQPGFSQRSGQGQPYPPSQGGQPGHSPSNTQQAYPPDPRYAPQLSQHGAPTPGHYDPNQPKPGGAGPGSGSGSQGASGGSGGSRISLKSLLN